MQQADIAAGAYRLIRRVTPPRARQAARRISGRRFVKAQRAALQPELSVVIPVYNVAEYLRQCLDSALGQTLQNLEVIAVDDGSTDGCLAILREYEERDGRVRVYQQTNSGQGIARNLGTEHARGEFLTFLDADDTVPPAAYGYMVNTLRTTGSDFAVGSARRVSNDTFQATGWARTVHRSDRLGTTIDDFPDALQDIIACNRMFRTEFWRDKVTAFRGHIAYEDHVPMLAAYVRATRFDVLARITYNWRIREDKTSTGQQKHKLENLLDRIAVKEEAHEMLQKEASALVRDAWVARAIEVDLPAFIGSAEAGNDLYRNVLTAAYRTFFDRASDAALRDVRFFQKVRGWLVAEGRWADLDVAQTYFRVAARLPPSTVVDGRIVASVPEHYQFPRDLPPRVSELSTHETAFEAGLERVRWDGGRLHLAGWALIRSLDTSTVHPHTEAWLESSSTGARVDLSVVPTFNPAGTTAVRHLSVVYDAAGFELAIDSDELLAATALTSGADTWTLRLRVTHLGVTREGTVYGRAPMSSAGRLLGRALEHEGDQCLVMPQFDGAHGFSIAVERSQVVAEDLAVASGTTLTGVIRVVDRALGTPQSVVARADSADGQVSARVHRLTPATYAFEISLPARHGARAAAGPRTWSVTTRFEGRGPAGEVPVTAPAAWQPASSGTLPTGALAWRRDGRQRLGIERVAPALRVTSFDLLEDGFRLGVEHRGLTPEDLGSAALVAEYIRLALVDVEPAGDGASVLRFSRTRSNLGGPALPAPSGRYLLTVRAEGRSLVATCSDELVPTLPVHHVEPDLAVRVGVRHSGEFLLHVVPPLAPDEDGRTRQALLQQAYAVSEVAPTDSVLFQCYRGEFATDSQRALDIGLRTARPDLVRYWGVLDMATEVPEGSVPVVIGSRQWYDVLASSRYLCNNIDFDGFFKKRPHQRYLQTFHGYPFKSMGASFWAGKGFGPDRIARECARRNEDWDAILVPSEVCAEMYRTEYDYRGEILVTGYPRSDFVVNADRQRVRQEVLGRLGVPEGRTTVLYAPTYRDNLTTRTYAAKRFDELDLVEMTRALGPDVVVLLRGHNNNQRELDRVLSIPNVVDVTDYPEINELTVAADVAILDYSSLRFEWALTGKPVLFFVPDVDSYFASRPPLFDYAGTAPGPWLSTTAEVVDNLRDLDRLAEEYAPQIAEFNARFNQLQDGKATDRVIEAFFG